MTAQNKIYFYPLWLRIWHGINAIGIILLILTGISMNSAVKTSIIGFNTAVNLHNIAGVVVSFNYLLFVFGNMFTTNRKFYIIKPRNFIKRPLKQAYYYAWGMFHGMKAPYPLSDKRKFNPLQKYFYVAVMYLVVPAVIITGFALLFPELIIERVYTLSGVFITAVLHSALGFFISIFLMIHLYVASIGKSPVENFKSIISGWHHI
ncbi:cytochrome b/b6 domain-containing protein [uncultured Draconibacterium sp.]|uniref:cytochrome b/b6 domain-containing protein n=1 Tax=uncultured Draconibacterium sp. TaxID=1573823 RepID=UPI003216B3F7